MGNNTSIIGDRQLDGTLSYMCLQKDIERLPKDVPDGSVCYVINTGNSLIFKATTGQWSVQ